MARIQKAIAKALVRPTSASTGEQLNKFEHTRGDSRFSDTVAEDAENQEHWQSQLAPHLTSRLEGLNNLREKVKSGKSRDQISEIHLNKAILDTERQLANPPTSRVTNRSVTLAALLGKQAVDEAFHPDRFNKTTDRHEYYPEDGDYRVTFDEGDLARSKATHRANTRNLTRGERLKERIAPYRAAAYRMTDAYGGHEEGGWWYPTGDLVAESRPYMTRRGAQKAEKKLQEQGFKRGTKSILNVSPSDAYQADADQGVFDPIVYTDNRAEWEGMPSSFIQEPSDEDLDYSHFGKKSEDYRTFVTRGKPLSNFPGAAPHYE